MHGYQTKIALSWSILILALLHWLFLESDYFIYKIVIIIAVAIRANSRESDRIEKIIKSNSLSVKLSFIYVFGWFLYVMYIYFQNPNSSEQILNSMQLTLFLIPIFSIFIINDIKWYFRCNENQKT